MTIKHLGFTVAYVNKIFWHRGLLKKIRQGGTVEACLRYPGYRRITLPSLLSNDFGPARIEKPIFLPKTRID
jgi:hypothetical protein